MVDRSCANRRSREDQTPVLLVGSPQHFAIESEISEAYASRSLLALGYFVLHVNGRAYGVKEPDATMLAVSFDEVHERLARRGSHVAPEIESKKASIVAEAFVASYLRGVDTRRKLGLTPSTLFDRHVIWAPDGDEAFDDGSYVLHLDVAEQSRLIAFKSGPEGVSEVSEAWLTSDVFYGLLSKWLAAFSAERDVRPQFS